MDINITTQGDFKNVINKLESASNKNPMSVMKQIGGLGVDALRDATPKDTSETANSWNYEAKLNRKGAELNFYNTGHPGASVNVARLIQVGHGTGTGGYVPPRNYINPAMDSVFSRTKGLLSKELLD